MNGNLTWGGVSCRGCGTDVPLFDAGRPLDNGPVLSREDEQKLQELARSEAVCPNCGIRLAGSRLVPLPPPSA